MGVTLHPLTLTTIRKKKETTPLTRNLFNSIKFRSPMSTWYLLYPNLTLPGKYMSKKSWFTSRFYVISHTLWTYIISPLENISVQDVSTDVLNSYTYKTIYGPGTLVRGTYDSLSTCTSSDSELALKDSEKGKVKDPICNFRLNSYSVRPNSYCAVV